MIHCNRCIPWLASRVGLLVGLTGVGGGSLMTPLLILLFGIHPATAVGTDLLYAAATKTAGSAVHGFNRTIDWRVVRLLATGSVPATVVTILALSHLGINSPAARNLITVFLTIALFLTAATLVFREKIVARYAKRLTALQPNEVATLTISVGAILGVLVSITSVGAGAIGVTALILLYPNLPTARIVGSDIAHAVPLTLAAGIGHLFLGFDRCRCLGIPAGWFDPGHSDRQPCRSAHSREGASSGTGRNPDRRRDQDDHRYASGAVAWRAGHGQHRALIGPATGYPPASDRP